MKEIRDRNLDVREQEMVRVPGFAGERQQRLRQLAALLRLASRGALRISPGGGSVLQNDT